MEGSSGEAIHAAGPANPQGGLSAAGTANGCKPRMRVMGGGWLSGPYALEVRVLHVALVLVHQLVFPCLVRPGGSARRSKSVYLPPATGRDICAGVG